MKFRLRTGFHQTRRGQTAEQGQIIESNIDLVAKHSSDKFEAVSDDVATDLTDLPAPTGIYKPDEPETLPRTFDLGVNLDVPGMKLIFTIVDSALPQIPWQDIQIDMEAVIKSSRQPNANPAVHGYLNGFDNDHIRLVIIDAETGKFSLTDVGRQFSLYKVAAKVIPD